MINNEYEGKREKEGMTAIHFVMVIKLMSVIMTNHMTRRLVCCIDRSVLSGCTVLSTLEIKCY